MYPVLLAIQYIGMVLLAAEIIYILRQRKSNLQMLLSILVIAIMINVVGYTMEMQAGTQELAMQAVKVSYIGKPFILLAMFFFVMEYCGVRLPNLLKTALTIIATGISALVFTSDYHTLFYSSVDFVDDGYFPHLVLGHGVLYNVYTLLIAAYLFIICVTCIIKYRKSQDRLVKKQLIFLNIISLLGGSGLIFFLLGITGGYDTTLIPYMISATLFILLLTRYRLFDALTIAKDEAVDHLHTGLIVLNSSGDALYTNIMADRVISAMAADDLYAPMDHCGRLNALKAIAQDKHHLYLDQLSGDRHSHAREGEKCVYEVVTRSLQYEGTGYGSMILLNEVTDSFYYTARLKKEVSLKTEELLSIQREIISSLATMMEARDTITGLHVRNTGKFVHILVKAMQDSPLYQDDITPAYAKMVSDAAYLHDIGKIAIPDSILCKDGKLTDEEFAKMKTHPEEGGAIIEKTLRGLETDEYLQIAKDMALYHHEKYNGQGYPCGLAGEAIPLSARIMAVADVYEALRSRRHYKAPFTREKAMGILSECSGTHFDPEIVRIFLDHIDEIEASIEA